MMDDLWEFIWAWLIVVGGFALFLLEDKCPPERYSSRKCDMYETCKDCWIDWFKETVVHGRWLSLEEYSKKIGADVEDDSCSGWIYCSECGQPSRSFNNWNWCPNCGAKMDGDMNA